MRLFALLPLSLCLIPSSLAQAPFRAISVTPSTTPVPMDQAVTYTARFDTSPGQTISFVFITFAPWPSEPYSCKVGVAINPFDGTPQGIYLHDDQGNEFNSMPFRSGNTEENSQCLLNASSSYVDPEATYVNVVFTLTFKSPFNGFRNLWVDAADTSSPEIGRAHV